MDLSVFTEERQQREHLTRHFLKLLEEEEEAPSPEFSPFSFLQFVEDRGQEHLATASNFT
jgi:hypothetical protein